MLMIIKGGGHEMVAMTLMIIHAAIIINVTVAISWPRPLISQPFSPRLLKAHPFIQLGCFLHGLLIIWELHLRAHTHISRPDLESGALDHSATLTVD